MHDLSYYRKLYEYEIHHGHLNRIKNYINHRKIDIMQDFHKGELHISSPFLLDEIEWEIDVENEKAKAVLYQLKILSRKFYTSLINTNFSPPDNHDLDLYLSLGYKFINGLIKLKSYNKAHYFPNRLSISQILIFSTSLLKSFRALTTSYKSIIICWLISLGSLL